MIQFRGCPPIRIDGSLLLRGLLGLSWCPSPEQRQNANQYERAVETQLNAIASRVTGRALLGVIRLTGRRVSIVPYTPESPDYWRAGACNASTRGNNPRGSMERGVEFCQDGPGIDCTSPANRFRGTGAGTDSTIYYSPSLWTGGSPAGASMSTSPTGCSTTCGPAHNADEVLFHELVHAYRQLMGRQSSLPIRGAARPYERSEEFLAVTVTNVYLSEKHAPRLRGGHDDSTLAAELSTSTGFLLNRDLHQLIRALEPSASYLYMRLSEIDERVAPFNPFRELVRNPAIWGPAVVL